MLPQRVNIYDGTEFVRLRIDLRRLHLQGAILLYGFFKEDRSVERVSRVNGRLSNIATLVYQRGTSERGILTDAAFR
jgi:hypothetical protein